MPAPGLVVRFKVFRGIVATWSELFTKAAEFANTLEPNRLITISHSEDQQDGIVAVWYWGEPA
jgi:hypothetical protein